MKAGFVNQLGRHCAQPADHFAANRDAACELHAAQAMLFRGGEQCGDDRRACMRRAAFVGVVEVFAVRRRAVAKRRHREAARIGPADDGASARIVGGRERCLHEIAIARRDAKPRDVDQQRLANRLHGRGRAGRQAGNDIGHLFAHSARRKCRAHMAFSVKASSEGLLFLNSFQVEYTVIATARINKPSDTLSVMKIIGSSPASNMLRR